MPRPAHAPIIEQRVKIAVIGAGPAGITAAYQLAKGGADVHLYEAGDQVGGLAKSIDLWDQTVDLGPHRFFSSDKNVNSLWLEVVGEDYAMVDRLTRILYKNKFYYYPLKPFDALGKLGLFEAARCMLSFVAEKIRPTKQTGSFESWVTGRFGKRLFQIFFKTYSEKLWGIGCDELDADFAAQRIKKLSLFEVVKNAITAGKNNKHKTLVDQFAYPLDGTGMVYNRMKARIEENGGKVFMSTPVQQVNVNKGIVSGLQLVNGEIREYDQIISSMPLTQMVARLPEVPKHILELNRKLKFRNTILVFLQIDAVDLFPDNWLYIHSDDLEVGRITNFQNWVPEINKGQDKTILVLEYWCYDQDEFWTRDEGQIIDLAKKEIRATGLAKDAAILNGKVVRLPQCYPVYNRGYKENLKPVEDYLSQIDGLSVIGRYGAFKYNNQDHSILMGMLAAENLLKGKNHNLWDINTDYDSYQESYIITKTGLKKS